VTDEYRRTVDDSGRVTLPEDLRNRLDIRPGDEVTVRDADGRIVLERSFTRTDLATAYRKRGSRDAAIAAEFAGVSAEAENIRGDVPDW